MTAAKDARLDDAVTAAWRRNWDVNAALLDRLEPEMLGARSPGGGPSVAQLLVHMVETTKFWGDRLDPVGLAALPDLYHGEPESGEPGALEPETDVARIRTVWGRVVEAALTAAIEHPEGAADSPHADGAAFLVHMMVHDAHHRGQILLALKVAGHALPDEEALWGPWRS